MKKTPLRKISAKQREKNKLWAKVTLQKWIEQDYTCSWCGQYLRNPVGHHIIKRRFNVNTKDNCYVVHAYPCHMEITDNNVDVNIFKNKTEWDKRDKAKEAQER